MVMVMALWQVRSFWVIEHGFLTTAMMAFSAMPDE